MKYIFDLDETLIRSTELNNDAYNYALEKYGYPRVVTKERLTREELGFIPSALLQRIICEKQKYFTSEWLPYRIIINSELVGLIKKYGKKDCYLWTKASKNRVTAILKYCNFGELFNKVIYDKKVNYKKTIAKLQTEAKSCQFVIYENNFGYFENEEVKEIGHIQTHSFNVCKYLISL